MSDCGRRRLTSGKVGKPPLLPAVLVLLVAASCADPPPEVFEHRVWDSAGVELIETGSPAFAGDEGWEIAPDPILELGQRDGTEPFLFSRIWDALLLPDGRIVVSDNHEPHVRIFGADGSHLSSFGRPGEAPMDFGAPPMLAYIAPDTLLTWDPHFYRLSRYDFEGNLLDQLSMNTRIREEYALPHIFGAAVWQLGSDGSLLWTGSLTAHLESEGFYEITLDPILFGSDDDPVVFDPLPLSHAFGFRVSDGFVGRIFNPFLHRATAVRGQDPGVVVSAPSELPEVVYHGASGETLRILRAPVPRSPVSRSMVRDERVELGERVLTWSGPVTPAQAQDAFDGLPIPDSLPAFQGLHIAPSGNIWTERRTAEADDQMVFDIFAGEDGRWLSTVRAPLGVRRILAIGPEAVLTEYLDDLGVPHIRLYPVERPSGWHQALQTEVDAADRSP